MKSRLSMVICAFSMSLVVGLGGCDVGTNGGGNNGDGGDGGNGNGIDLSVPGFCEGLECQINHQCPGGAKTTITGTVYAPNGTLPLYNAVVFIPNATVEPFTSGVTCDRCDGAVSGKPVGGAVLTGPDGKFIITDVPTGTAIPLVVQVGRWRRQVTINVPDCATTPLDSGATRLPKNRSEGDMPQMAIATGSSDHFECLLLKIGLDKAEITAPNAAIPGKVHFYTATDSPGLDLPTPAPKATQLYASLANMLKYDVILLPCEGEGYDKSQSGGTALNPNPRSLITQYLDAGGRVFSTHYSYDWFTYDQSPFNKLATPLKNGLWPVKQGDDYNNTIHATLDTSFPKGSDFAKWLKFAGAASAVNQLDIAEGRHDVTGVDKKYAQQWASYDFTPVGSGPGVMHFTFNTPLDPPKDDMGAPLYCGRAVYSDFHVTAGAVTAGPGSFPDRCKVDPVANPMLDQEKALAFMLFDLSSCIQQDSQQPIP